ncbi:MAG: FKBP-type peptidyl-prolyl cis-trans isomerase [Cyclobacteriaceae bacterium]
MLKRIMTLAVAGVLMYGCASDSNEITTDSGMKVTFLNKGEAEVGPEDGQILTLNMRYEDERGVELFNTDKQGGPVAMQYIDSVWSQSGLIYEALRVLKKGDSVTFQLPANDFYVNTFDMEVPDSIAPNSQITFNIGLVDNMSRDEYIAYQRQVYEKQQAEMAMTMDQKLEEDGQTIDQYLSDNNIEAQSTASGLRYVITEEGSGPSPETGQTVSVHYRGMLMDGTQFDASYDRGAPLDFPIGQGQVIRGWDEGIALLNKGAKATLYIPSPLAYGERGAGSVIPPFAILKFDVELVDFQ